MGRELRELKLKIDSFEYNAEWKQQVIAESERISSLPAAEMKKELTILRMAFDGWAFFKAENPPELSQLEELTDDEKRVYNNGRLISLKEYEAFKNENLKLKPEISQNITMETPNYQKNRSSWEKIQNKIQELEGHKAEKSELSTILVAEIRKNQIILAEKKKELMEIESKIDKGKEHE